MKKNYNLISYFVYMMVLLYVLMRMFNTGMKVFDLPYLVTPIYYLFMLGWFSSIMFSMLGNYDVYMKRHASYLLIRYGNFRKIYYLFVVRGFLHACIFTFIKVVVDLFVFGSTNFVDILMYFMVITVLLLIHMNFEVFINFQFAIMTILGYFTISFSIADIFIDNHMESFVYFFIPNMLFASRRGSVLVCLLVLVFLWILNFMIGRIMIEKKEIL